MATRNIVPRANEEGNIGTLLKNWLKGWFKDLFISGNLTDGTNNITIADIQDTIDLEHSHLNKVLLDSIIDSGLGTKFLSDDGSYKSALGTGDMTRIIYDIDDNGIVDKAEALNDGSTGGGNNVTAQEAREHIDDTSNPHAVTPGQIGASPTGHTHVEADITDLDHYTSSDFATDFGLADLANLGTKDHSSLTNKNTETDIKHVTDDQKDALDNANSPDSANPVATINDLPIFGQNFEYHQSLGVSITTSATFQNKLSFTTASLPAGTYRIGWAYGWNHDATDTNFESRLVLDGDTDVDDLLMFHVQEPSDSGGTGAGRYSACGTDQNNRNSGFRYITFGSPGTHTIDLDYRTSSAGDESSIFDAIVELWRVE